MEANDDRQLMLRFQTQGDQQAFRQLFQRHKDALLAFLLRLAESPTQAEEVSQIVWTKLLEIAERGAYRADERAQFRSYLFTLARNAFHDEWRRGMRIEYRDEVPEPEVGDTTPIESALGEAEVGALLEREIRRLPVEQREVVALWSEGVSYQAIAEIVGVPVNTVIGRKRYAVERLRTELQRHGIDWSVA